MGKLLPLSFADDRGIFQKHQKLKCLTLGWNVFSHGNVSNYHLWITIYVLYHPKGGKEKQQFFFKFFHCFWKFAKSDSNFMCDFMFGFWNQRPSERKILESWWFLTLNCVVIHTFCVFCVTMNYWSAFMIGMIPREQLFWNQKRILDATIRLLSGILCKQYTYLFSKR